jgi:hypothetical protein
VRPGDLLECQRDLRRRFDDEEFRAVMVGSLAMAAGFRPEDARNGRMDREGAWVRSVLDVSRASVEKAQVYDVVRPMVDLTQWAAATMDDLTPFDRSLPFSEWGLVRFDGGIKLADRRGEDIGLDWLLWFPVHNETGHGYGLLGFNDAKDNPDGVTTSLRAHWAANDGGTLWSHLGRWAYSFFATVLDGERIGPPLVDGAQAWQSEAADDAAERVVMPSTNVARLMVALWTLMREPVVALEHERPDRATAKRMRRMKMPESVTVITLRHLSEKGDPRGEVEWQHHWIVRGHYRWQAHGKNREQRRLIYIAPHMKGNQEGPLLVTKKVHRLAR